MTTVQIVGIAVAAAVVLLLVIALVVTRRRGRPESPPPGTSFLDLSPQDTFDGLGRAEQPVEDVTLDARAVRSLQDDGAAAGATAAATAAPDLPATEPEEPTARVEPAAAPDDGGLSPLPDGPAHAQPGAPHDAVLPVAPRPAEQDAASPEPAAPAASWDDLQPGTGQDADDGPQAFAAASHLSLDWGLEADPPDFAPAGGGSPAWDTDPFPRPPEVAPGAFDGVALSWAAVTGGGETGEEAQPAPGPAPRKVPLADIMVTTSSKVIDLDDPEVRRMLTDLVKFEIDQATRYREQGQHLDAVLQLTEAEKISRALGMTESAHAIHLMMQELQH